MLLRLPPELIDNIAFALLAHTPLGPPAALLPLLLTSKALHEQLAQPAFLARVCRFKLDTGAVARRLFTPYHADLAEHLVHACRLLHALRGGDVRDVDVENHLASALLLMLDNDGKNYAQLKHAGVHRYVETYVKERLWEGNEDNFGWPLDNQANATALWLMWLLTERQTLLSEHPHERESLVLQLLPFVVCPHLYPSSEAPPNHFDLPLDPANNPSHQTPVVLSLPNNPAHTYPHYLPPRHFSQIYFRARPPLSWPLASVAAKLLFVARRELRPIAIPGHIAPGPGVPGGALTQADYHELNAAKAAELPRGAIWDWERGVALAVNAPYTAPPFVPATPATGVAGAPPAAGVAGPGPAAAPPPAAGATANSSATPTSAPPAPPPPPEITIPPTDPESQKWDTTFWRMRLCADFMAPRPTFAPGQTFALGSMRGAWQGRIYIPQGAQYTHLLHQPYYPGVPDERAASAGYGLLTENSLGLVMQPIFLDVQEHHRVCMCESEEGEEGEGEGESEEEDDDDDDDDGERDDDNDSEVEDEDEHEGEQDLARPRPRRRGQRTLTARGCGVLPVPQPQTWLLQRGIDHLAAAVVGGQGQGQAGAVPQAGAAPAPGAGAAAPQQAAQAAQPQPPPQPQQLPAQAAQPQAGADAGAGPVQPPVQAQAAQAAPPPAPQPQPQAQAQAPPAAGDAPPPLLPPAAAPAPAPQAPQAQAAQPPQAPAPQAQAQLQQAQAQALAQLNPDTFPIPFQQTPKLPDRIDMSMCNAWMPGGQAGVSWHPRGSSLSIGATGAGGAGAGDDAGVLRPRDEVVFGTNFKSPDQLAPGGCVSVGGGRKDLSGMGLGSREAAATTASSGGEHDGDRTAPVQPDPGFVYETYDPARPSSHDLFKAFSDPSSSSASRLKHIFKPDASCPSCTRLSKAQREQRRREEEEARRILDAVMSKLIIGEDVGDTRDVKAALGGMAVDVGAEEAGNQEDVEMQDLDMTGFGDELGRVVGDAVAAAAAAPSAATKGEDADEATSEKSYSTHPSDFDYIEELDEADEDEEVPSAGAYGKVDKRGRMEVLGDDLPRGEPGFWSVTVSRAARSAPSNAAAPATAPETTPPAGARTPGPTATASSRPSSRPRPPVTTPSSASADPPQAQHQPLQETRTFVPATRREYDRSRIGVPCHGVKDIAITGETGRRHRMWQDYRCYGRVRMWDGLVGILRFSRRSETNSIFIFGYVVGDTNFVGEWRVASSDPLRPVWGSAFVMSKRRDVVPGEE